jgi:hypothetical protein
MVRVHVESKLNARLNFFIEEAKEMHTGGVPFSDVIPQAPSRGASFLHATSKTRKK